MMQSLTNYQIQEIRGNFLFLLRYTGGQSDVAAITQALCARCPGLDFSDTAEAVQRMANGISRYDSCREAATAEDGTIDPRLGLIWMAQGLDEQQRKGMYLQCYEFFRQADAQRIPEAGEAQDASEIAGLPEDALAELVSEQLRGFSAQLCEAALPSEAEAEAVTGRLANEPLAFAAAAYAAAVNGDLPESFEKNPELLGACCAAGGALGSALDKPGLEADEILEIVLDALLVIACVAGTIAILWAAAPAALAVMDVFMDMAAGLSLGILTPFVDFALCMAGGILGTSVMMVIMSIPTLLTVLAMEGISRAIAFYRSHKSLQKDLRNDPEAPETAPGERAAQWEDEGETASAFA